MSIRLKYALRSPHARGMTISSTGDRGTYQWIAYRYDGEETYFACKAAAIQEVDGEPYHVGLRSLVKNRPMPNRSDENVWAIPHYEAMRLKALEQRWWTDYNSYLLHNAGSTGDEAARFAHRMVLEQNRE